MDDALRLGCVGVGCTICPVSTALRHVRALTDVAREAKDRGLCVVVWSYPRGGSLSKEGETAIDVAAYAAHIAAEMGAHIVKVKLPDAYVEQAEAMKVYEREKISIATLAERVRHVVQATFNGRRVVIFSGGALKGPRRGHPRGDAGHPARRRCR